MTVNFAKAALETSAAFSVRLSQSAEEFFEPALGAEPAPLQHLVWFFGHWEVYLPFILLIMLSLAWLLLRKFGRPRGISGLWLYGGGLFLMVVIFTGVKLSASAIDSALHDTYYVVAHFHFAIPFGIGFLMFWALLAKFNRIFRFEYSRLLAHLHFWLFFIGVMLTWLPQFFIGMQGMPNRYIDYTDTFNWSRTLSNIGVGLTALSLATFVILIIEALVRKRPIAHKAADPIESAFE